MFLKTLNNVATSLVLCIIILSIGYFLAYRLFPYTVPALSPIPFAAATKTSILPYMHTADPQKGQAIFIAQCVRCHSLHGQTTVIGPSLDHITGRPISSSPSYPYSPSLRSKKSLKWDEQTLSDWIEDPNNFAAGTRMSFGGLESAQQRADVISFLYHAQNAKPTSPPSKKH